MPSSQMPSDAKVADAIVADAISQMPSDAKFADAIVADTIVAILYLSHLQKVYIYEQKYTNLFAKPCRL